MAEFISNLLDLIVIIMNVCGILLLGREVLFELVDAGIVAMAEMRG